MYDFYQFLRLYCSGFNFYLCHLISISLNVAIQKKNVAHLQHRRRPFSSSLLMYTGNTVNYYIHRLLKNRRHHSVPYTSPQMKQATLQSIIYIASNKGGDTIEYHIHPLALWRRHHRVHLNRLNLSRRHLRVPLNRLKRSRRHDRAPYASPKTNQETQKSTYKSINFLFRVASNIRGDT